MPAFKNRSGFTLVEFLVAIVILMVGLLGLLQTVNVALNHSLQNDLRNSAVAVADEEMAKTLAVGYDNISSGTPKNVERKVLQAFKNYSVSRLVTQISSGAGASTRQVDIAVSWNHRGARYNHGASGMLTKN